MAGGGAARRYPGCLLGDADPSGNKRRLGARDLRRGAHAVAPRRRRQSRRYPSPVPARGRERRPPGQGAAPAAAAARRDRRPRPDDPRAQPGAGGQDRAAFRAIRRAAGQGRRSMDNAGGRFEIPARPLRKTRRTPDRPARRSPLGSGGRTRRPSRRRAAGGRAPARGRGDRCRLSDASAARTSARPLEFTLLYVGGRPTQIGHLRAFAERRAPSFCTTTAASRNAAGYCRVSSAGSTPCCSQSIASAMRQCRWSSACATSRASRWCRCAAPVRHRFARR